MPVNGKTKVSLPLENKESQEAARSLSSQLYNNLIGCKRSEVAQHLSQNTDFGKMVGSNEKQKCILTHFSERYHHCNPTAVASVDVMHFMTCAMMLLNTDLHGHYGGIRNVL
uniref:SEC7 domain-containing protein n=1 Tax=Electrophorus electricus TaxID=8005 RepID=A0A4W4GQC6_ELEEL